MNTLNSATLQDWLRRAAAAFGEQRAFLTKLDADIGDGDHGENLARGFGAVVAKLSGWEGQTPGALFKSVAMTLIGTVGGASGPLYGSLFLDASKAAGDRAEFTLVDWTEVLDAGVKGVQNRGKAAAGDKTMLDALLPAVAALRESPDDKLAPALQRSADAAAQGAEATKPLVARKGRASYLGERSVGHPDPGAISSGMLLKALADAAAGDA